MAPSFIVINPQNGVIYQLSINGLNYGNSQCYWYQNTFSYDIMDKQRFEELLDIDNNEELKKFFDDMSYYMIYAILIAIAVVLAVYLGWQGFLFSCMISEAIASTLIVLIIIRLLSYLNI